MFVLRIFQIAHCHLEPPWLGFVAEQNCPLFKYSTFYQVCVTLKIEMEGVMPGREVQTFSQALDPAGVKSTTSKYHTLIWVQALEKV